MQIIERFYNHAEDYEQVGQFLLRTYRTTGSHINWLQSRWEYMHYHSLVENVDLNAIGVWEANGAIVGVIHPEHQMGTLYVEVDPEYGDLKSEMIRYAEEHLYWEVSNERVLRVYINDRDDAFQRVVRDEGYEKTDRGAESMSHFMISELFPVISLPDGFRLLSLAEDNDLVKIHRALWRGFNHEGEPPEDGIEGRKRMQSAPNFRKDLTIVVQAPDGHFVSYCGMWYDDLNKVAYVEPVATDPDYRRMGLGRAAVLESIRCCGEQGATVAYVGTSMPFYLSFGFETIYTCSIWHKKW